MYKKNLLCRPRKQKVLAHDKLADGARVARFGEDREAAGGLVVRAAAAHGRLDEHEASLSEQAEQHGARGVAHTLRAGEARGAWRSRRTSADSICPENIA